MPLITQNSPLGSAFGGKIVSLNYNYQPNTEPSSATITIISENNKFIEPEHLSDFVIPNLKAKTKITEVQYNDDGNTKVLQIELQDRLSFILDKNIILVRGIHSSGVQGDIVNGSFKFQESAGVAGSQYFQPVIGGITNIGLASIIGSLKTVLSFEPGENEDGTYEKVFGPQTATFINGTLIKKDDIKNYDNKLQEKSYSIENSWGYTLSDLLNVIKNLGLKIKGSTFFSDNPLFFFSETGTVRSVLNSCLSRLGKSFYVDPIDESIVVTDNTFITNINKNIKSIYDGNINNLGAVSLNIKKSCRDVAGRHFIVRSAPISATSPQGGGGSAPSSSSTGEGRPNASKFKKVFFDKSAKEIVDGREKELVKRLAYLYGTEIDDNLIQNYIFALAKKYDPHNWSNYEDLAVYGGVKKDKTTYIDKTNFLKAVFDTKNAKPTWQEELEANPPHNFDIKNLLGAYPNTRTALVKRDGFERLSKEALAATPPDKLRQFVEDLTFVAKGVFVSSPIQSLRRASGWDFVDTRGLQMIGPFKSSEKIKNISELAPIQRLFDRIGGNPNLTIDNLRKAAGQDAGLGKNPYFWIGITTNKGIPVGPKFNESYDIAKLLEKNFYLLSLEEENELAPQQYLFFTKNSEKIINDIEKVCLHAWNYTFNEGLKDLNIRYIYRSIAERRGDNASFEGGGADDNESQDAPELPTFMSIAHLPSTAKLSSKTELDFYEGQVGEAQAVLSNVNKVSIEQDGPFYEASISYFRPPISSDLNVNNGFSSISSSFSGGDGVTTSISYSTRKYQNVDKSVVSQIGSSSISGPMVDDALAFAKNSGLVSFNTKAMNNINSKAIPLGTNRLVDFYRNIQNKKGT